MKIQHKSQRVDGTSLNKLKTLKHAVELKISATEGNNTEIRYLKVEVKQNLIDSEPKTVLVRYLCVSFHNRKLL